MRSRGAEQKPLGARDGSRRACESGCPERAGSVTGISCDYGSLLWEASTRQGPEPEPMVPACFALLACQPQGVLPAAGQLSQPPCGLVLRARVAGVLSPCAGPWALRCSCHTLGFAIGRRRCWAPAWVERGAGCQQACACLPHAWQGHGTGPGVRWGCLRPPLTPPAHRLQALFWAWTAACGTLLGGRAERDLASRLCSRGG